MPAYPPKTDIGVATQYVRLVPIADIQLSHFPVVFGGTNRTPTDEVKRPSAHIDDGGRLTNRYEAGVT